MRYKLYSLSAEAMVAMREAIAQAKTSLYWESYIFQNEVVVAHNFFELFLEKARSGVRVVIILDGFGSAYLREHDVAALRAAGAEVLFFSSWFRRVHRKILVVDERVGFFGGVNVGRAYVGWLDLHVRVQGRLVQALVRTFAHSYEVCGGASTDLLEKHKLPAVVVRTKIWLLEHWPVLNKRRLRTHYEERIRSAKKHIVFVSPYFIPHAWLITLLREAQERGVTVDVILPQYTDPKIATIANYLNARRLESARMHFYFTKEMVHAKALLIDDTEGMIGSQNIDAFSFDHNTEMSAVFSQKSMIRDLRRILERWKSEAVPFQKLAWKPRWYHNPLTYILDWLQPIL